MGLAEQYRERLMTPEQAVQAISSGNWVDYGSFGGQALVLDKALAARRDELTDVKVRGMCRLGVPEVAQCDPQAAHFTYNSWHFSAAERKLHDRQLCSYIPMFYHELPRLYREFCEVDVAMIATAPMDSNGFFNFGPQCSHAMAICDRAKKVILEVNPNMPCCLGGREECISLTRVDGIVEVDWAIPELPAAVPSAADRVIATHVVERLRDGCCIQLGIGGLPNAVGELISRSNLKELGIHTEMFTDSMVDMIESGQVTGTRKTLDRRKVVYTFALGSSRVYSYLKNNPIFAAFPVDYTNDPYIIGSNDNVVSINSCVEIDLFGQVCSESSGPRHISGTGGQVDFALGAMRSKGGAAFMCMPSTFDKKGALRSRIRPTLTEGSIVTTPRAAVSHVVTEQGVVCLKGMATWQRAEALISIAHPQFRDELVHAAEKLGIWRQSNKKS